MRVTRSDRSGCGLKPYDPKTRAALRSVTRSDRSGCGLKPPVAMRGAMLDARHPLRSERVWIETSLFGANNSFQRSPAPIGAGVD